MALARLAKRAFDLVGAGVALAVASPMLVATAAAVRTSMGSPVFFRQERLGYRNRTFSILKFRTMRHAMDASGAPLSDADRLTRVGKFLRATSLDELPELLNVLRGEMSLVGPRPLMAKYRDRYSSFQIRRHEVRPGITGWAQVQGRNAITWERKLELDVWYVDNWSLRLDVEILWRTILTVFRRKGVSFPGDATMPEFMGSGDEGR